MLKGVEWKMNMYGMKSIDCLASCLAYFAQELFKSPCHAKKMLLPTGWELLLTTQLWDDVCLFYYDFFAELRG